MTDPTGYSDEDRASSLRNAGAVEDLVAANAASTKTMLTLVDSVRKETAARDRKVDALVKSQHQMRIVIWMSAGLAVVLLLLAVINATNLNNARKSQKQLEQIAANSAATNRLVLDCLNRTGACGRVNAEDQLRVLDEVKKYNLIGFFCIRNNPATADPKAEKFLKCMDRLYPGGPILKVPS